MTTKVTIQNEPNDAGRTVKVTTQRYGRDTVQVVAPGDTVTEYVHQEQSLLIEEGDWHEANEDPGG